MSRFDASSVENEHVQCAVCEKVITGGKWFARIRHDRWMVALCCPLCTEAFTSKPHAYVRRIETLELASSPSTSDEAHL
jgi:hypothetical protein